MHRLARLLLLAAALAACAGPDATSTPSASDGVDASDGLATPMPEPTTRPTPTAQPPSPTPVIALPEPGRPYDADAILAAMRESRRPGGVPDQLETRAVAAALADRVWTLDGAPWERISIGASCGIDSCLVEVAGTPGGAVGEDLYVFDVDAADDRYEVVEATLLGIDPGTVDALDRFARDRSTEDLGDVALASARWLPPPDDGQFVLAYRSGGEEGSPRVDLLVDVAAGTVRPAP